MPPRGSYMNCDDHVLIDVLGAILVANLELDDGSASREGLPVHSKCSLV